MMMKATGKVRRTGIPTTTTVSKGTERGPGARPICLQGPGTRVSVRSSPLAASRV
jgi:hypothetical protein